MESWCSVPKLGRSPNGVAEVDPMTPDQGTGLDSSLDSLTFASGSTSGYQDLQVTSAAMGGVMESELLGTKTELCNGNALGKVSSGRSCKFSVDAFDGTNGHNSNNNNNSIHYSTLGSNGMNGHYRRESSSMKRRERGSPDSSCFVIFAINSDNISVHTIEQNESTQVHLITYNNEIEHLSTLSLHQLENIGGIRLLKPALGVCVLTTVANLNISVSKSAAYLILNVDQGEGIESDWDSETNNPALQESQQLLQVRRVVENEEMTDDSTSTLGDQVSARSSPVQPDQPRNGTVIAEKGFIEQGDKEEKCGVCRQAHLDSSCSILNPTAYIPDNTDCTNSSILALASLPSQVSLKLCASDRSYSVYASVTLPPSVALGPLRGVPVDYDTIKFLENLSHIWFMDAERPSAEGEGEERGEEESLILTTSDETSSNWCRYLKPTLRLQESNLICIQKHKKIYFVTSRSISPGEELQFYASFMDNQQHLEFQRDSFTCIKCKLHFQEAMSLVKHMRLVHPKGPLRTKTPCSVCKRVFYNMKALTKHARQSHEGVGVFRCEECGKHFLHSRPLQHHMQVEHRSSSEFSCPICGRGLHSGESLQQHLTTWHSSKDHPCPTCHKSFRSRLVLSRHLKTHSTEFRFYCPHCSKGFRDGSNLKVHLLTHSGIKPFSCHQPGCRARFTTKQCLQIHYRKAHSFTDETMPPILREVPFTVEAYSAGCL